MGIKLPTMLPTSLDKTKIGIQLPIKLPFKIGKVNADNVYYQEKIRLSLVPTAETTKNFSLKISCVPTGEVFSMPIRKTAWEFKGLIIDENIVSKRKTQLLVDEKIYSQIVVSFELLNENQLKITWSGTRVPRVQIYTKSLEQENYILYNTYAWNRNGAILPIRAQNYYIKLVGINDSGSSEEYLINSPIEIGIEPVLNMVNSTDKIYNIDVSYTSEYNIEVEY